MPDHDVGIDEVAAGSAASMFLGRESEFRRLGRIFDDVRAGSGRAVVVRGEAGIGKSALVARALANDAPSLTIIRVLGVEPERELAFAALQQVCGPLLHIVGELPPRQASALRVALGLDSGPPADRFVVGLATLGLLAEVSRTRPVMLVVDDAQWLDRASAQVLGLVARRLRAESIGVLFLLRADPGHEQLHELDGLEVLAVPGLADDDALTLLRATYPGLIDEAVANRVVAESGGNPLALLELPRGFTPAELAGGFGSIEGVAVPRRIEESFRRQVRALPYPLRQLLLIAACEPTGDPTILWRAADRLHLGLPPDSETRAAVSGLVQLAPRVSFRHPLLRSAVYRRSSAQERRRVHAALAAVTDDRDRRAWHRAQAVSGPDEAVAAELDAAAVRALGRGAPASAGALYERSSELSGDPRLRAGRQLEAAESDFFAGVPEAAERVLGLLSPEVLDGRAAARLQLLRARLAFLAQRGPDATLMLLDASHRLEALDPDLALETRLEALQAGWFVGQTMPAAVRDQLFMQATRVPPGAQSDRATGLLLEGLLARHEKGYAAGAPALARSIDEYLAHPPATDLALRRLWFAACSAVDLLRAEQVLLLTERLLRLVHSSGVSSLLLLGLTFRAVVLTYIGDLSGAGHLLVEVNAAAGGLDLHEPAYADMVLAAWRGQPRAVGLAEEIVRESEARGEGVGIVAAHWAKALWCNGSGRYEDALSYALKAAAVRENEGHLRFLSAVEAVVAAVHLRDRATARQAAQIVESMAAASETDWALGLSTRCRAMLADDQASEGLFESALEHLSRASVVTEHARTELYFAERLRRCGRKREATERVARAYVTFVEVGAAGFAELAARELAAVGAPVRPVADQPGSGLTRQETAIVQLAREGLTNAEIANRLFISARTVEWHLGRSYAKLGISSRRDLRR
jgi:DNA-binding CsgD family transcriptional regulator